jgi:hypothetical protein
MNSPWSKVLGSRLGRRLSELPRNGHRVSRLRLESLEDRTVPSTYYWVGAGGTGWSNPSNWDLNGTLAAGVPGAGDVAAFSNTVPAYANPSNPQQLLVVPLNQTPVYDLSADGSLGAMNFASGWTGNLTVNHSFTVTGVSEWDAGTIIVVAGATLTNSGTIILNNASGTSDVLAGGGTLSNEATAVIQQTSTGGLVLSSAGSGTTTVINAGLYSISADSGITAATGGGAVVNNGTLQKAAGNGTSTVNPGAVSNVGTVFAHSGTFDLEGVGQVNGALLTGGSWGAETPATLVLNGGAAITSSSAAITLAGAGAHFANLAGNLTSNSGNFLLSNGAIDSVPGSFENSGTLTVTPGSTLTANQVLNSSNGTIVGGGTVNTVAGQAFPGVTNYGELIPASPTGTLTVAGAYSQPPGSQFDVQINGTAPGTQYTQLKLNGPISLAGRLHISTGFQASAGNQFVIVQNNGSAPINGTFDGLPEGGLVVVGNQVFKISYHGGAGNDVVLTVPGPGNGPTVRLIQVNDGTPQRSEVRSLSVFFSTTVQFVGGNANVQAAFKVTNAVYGTDAAISVVTINADDQGRTYITLYFFGGPETDPVSSQNGAISSLADGRYQLTVYGNMVYGTNGVPLDGAGNGQPGSNYVSPPDSGPGQTGLRLYRLFGDVNGDGVVDPLDLNAFRLAFNTNSTNPQFVSNLDANNNGVIDPVDLNQFRTRFNTNVWLFTVNPQFYVNPATGNDANDGRTQQTAWATWGRLVQAAGDGTIPAGTWVTNNGAPADLATIPTTQNKDDWYTAYLAGDRHVTGGIVNIDTSLAPLQVTAGLTMPPGTEIRSATDQLTDLRVNVPVAASEVWNQPDATNAPDVWGTTSLTDYSGTVLYEMQGGQWAQLLPIGFDRSIPNLATALPLLEANPGSFYADPSTHRLYTHAITGGNPNTDGVGRQYVPPWAAVGARRIVDVTGGMALRIGGDGGFGFDPTSSQANGSNGVGSGEWGAIAVIDSCEWSRAGKHTFAAVGNFGAGLVIFRNDVATEGPGGVFFGYWSHFVDYTSYAGAGSIVSIYDGCSTVDGTANVDAPGGSDALPYYLAFLEHTDGGNIAFAQRILTNCVFNGATSVGGNTAVVKATNCIFNGDFNSTAVLTSVDGGSMGFELPFLGGSTQSISILTGVTLRPGNLFTSTPRNNAALIGTITLQNSVIDLAAGNNYAAVWDWSYPSSLTLMDCTVQMANHSFYGFLYVVGASLPPNPLRISQSAFTGDASWPMVVVDHPDGTRDTYSWQWARDQGFVDNTNTINGSPWLND